MTNSIPDTIPNSISQPIPDLISESPLVSVIMIFFNAKQADFFDAAIASILAQTYDHWELILADDGSTDGSSTIAQSYAQQHPDKIRYVTHPEHQNLGMSATRNLGIRHAQGEYIAFLDADDVWLPPKLAQQVPLFQAHPEAAMLYGRTQYWWSWAQDQKAIQADALTVTSSQFDQLIAPPTQLLASLQNPQIYPCTCSILIRRWVFDALGGFEAEFRNANEDLVFHSKLFLKFPVYVSSQCWDRYRRHPDSYWGRVTVQGKGAETARIARLTYLTWLEQYLREQRVGDAHLWSTLKRSRFACRYPQLQRWRDRLQHPQRSLQNLLKKVNKI